MLVSEIASLGIRATLTPHEKVAISVLEKEGIKESVYDVFKMELKPEI